MKKTFTDLGEAIDQNFDRHPFGHMFTMYLIGYAGVKIMDHLALRAAKQLLENHPRY